MESAEFNWGSVSAKVDAGLASLVLMQMQQWMAGGRWWMANGDVMGGMGFPGSRNMGKGSGGLVTPPSPRSLSADSNHPCRQCKRGNCGQSGSHSRSNLVKPDPKREAGAESDTSLIRWLYLPLLLDHSSWCRFALISNRFNRLPRTVDNLYRISPRQNHLFMAHSLCHAHLIILRTGQDIEFKTQCDSHRKWERNNGIWHSCPFSSHFRVHWSHVCHCIYRVLQPNAIT